jgi:hypothetical protein
MSALIVCCRLAVSQMLTVVLEIVRSIEIARPTDCNVSAKSSLSERTLEIAPLNTDNDRYFKKQGFSNSCVFWVLVWGGLLI